MKKKADWSLYLVTDQGLMFGRPIERVVEAAVKGGVTAVQLREKNCSTREYLRLARRLKEILELFRVPLIINDRVDVALVSGADGVHLGQNDMPFRDARALMGPEAFIGLSVETMEQAMEAEDLDVDYLGVSPIFSTPTKTDTVAEWGVEGLRRLRCRSRRVLVAIGSIKAANAAEIIRAGADGIAVVSGICSASDPEEASRTLKRIVDEARLRRSAP